MFDDEGEKKDVGSHVVGCDLSSLSIEELEKRVVLLREEIERLEAAADRKRQSMADAASFFKS